MSNADYGELLNIKITSEAEAVDQSVANPFYGKMVIDWKNVGRDKGNYYEYKLMTMFAEMAAEQLKLQSVGKNVESALVEGN